MSSSYQVLIELLNNIIVYLYRYVVPILYLVGNTGNIFSALILMKKAWKKNVCVFYLNICLLFTSFYINSTILTSIFVLGFQISVYNSSVLLCKIYYYAAFLSTVLFPTVLLLASIDRLLISSQNVDRRLYSSKRLAYFSISTSTCFWIVYNIHVLIKVNLQEIAPSVFLCFFDLSGHYLVFVSFSSLVYTSFFCSSMIILSIFSFKNVRHIRSIPRQQRHQIRVMNKRDFQLLRCLFGHNIIFIIFSVPLNIFYVYMAVIENQTQTPLEEAISNFLLHFLSFISQIPYCTSFLIFIVVSKAFQNDLKRLMYKIIGKDFIVIRDEEKKQENPQIDVVVSNIVLPD
jgi:hypothetical protein